MSIELSLRTILCDLFYRATACNATHIIHEKAVRPSVHQTSCFVTKRKKLVPTFDTIHHSFLTRRMVGGRRPLLPEIFATDAVGAKTPILS